MGFYVLWDPEDSLDIHSRIAAPNTFVNTHRWLLKWKSFKLQGNEQFLRLHLKYQQPHVASGCPAGPHGLSAFLPPL